jgi:hypothetical protein
MTELFKTYDLNALAIFSFIGILFVYGGSSGTILN